MLSLVPLAQHVPQQMLPERLSEMRELLHLVEAGRSVVMAAATTALLLLAVACLAVGFIPLAGLFSGAATTLSLHRYGPSWWPGRR